MNELSHYFGIKCLTVSKMIKNYEKKGWIERVHLGKNYEEVFISKFAIQRFII